MISFIVAMDKNRLIGSNNQLPWHLPEDLKFFKRITMGHPIVMGRKTYESIGRPLPGRDNIVLTKNTAFQPDGVIVIHSISEVKALETKYNDEIFVIGGAEIFKRTLSIVDRMYITLIDGHFEGDTYFPEFNKNQWELTSTEKGIKDNKNPYDYFYMIYDKKIN